MTLLDTGRELWTVSLSGVVSHVDIAPGSESSSPGGITACDGPRVLFTAIGMGLGMELWSSDGTPGGTYIVRDICDGPGSSSPAFITCFRGLFYFRADDCVHGPELWVSDGLRNGTTKMVRDVRSGSAGSWPSFFTVFQSPLDSKDYLMFLATDGLYTNGAPSFGGFGGSQLWRSDGTLEGTYRAIPTTENDIYHDITAMTLAFPESMIAVNGVLYIPGSRDVRVNGPALAYADSDGGQAQIASSLSPLTLAAAVGDTDTPTGAFLTLSIATSEGVLVVQASNESFPKTSFAFLLANADQPQQTSIIMNSLYNLGHTVKVVSTGEAVITAVTSPKMSDPYDCILLSETLNPTTLDFIAVLRTLRGKGVTTPVVAFSTESSFVQMALEAGATAFLIEPDLVVGSGDASIFQSFVQDIISVLQKTPPTLQVFVTNPYLGDLNISSANTFYGQSLLLNGTAEALNKALGSLSFFAPRGVYGRESIDFTLHDYPHPEACERHLLASSLYSNFSGNPGPQLCDSSTQNVVTASLPVLVVSTNSAPTINVSADFMNATVGITTSTPVITIADIDLTRNTQLLPDSYGRYQQPVYSVLITVEYGTVSFRFLDGVSLSAGQGFMDKLVALNGPIKSINGVLASMVYLCQQADFCSRTGHDSFEINVDDNGFTGVGGPLKSIANVAVNVSPAN